MVFGIVVFYVLIFQIIYFFHIQVTFVNEKQFFVEWFMSGNGSWCMFLERGESNAFLGDNGEPAMRVWSDSLTDLEEKFMEIHNYEDLQGGKWKGVRTKQRFQQQCYIDKASEFRLKRGEETKFSILL